MFQKAIASLRNHYTSPAHDGPGDYASFVQEPTARTPAFAAVQEFLRAETRHPR